MRYEYIESAYEPFVRNIKREFQNSDKTLFDKRNVIKVVEYEGKKFVVKSFKLPNPVNSVAYRYLRKSKARRSYENSIELLKRGVNVPKPIGYIEFGSLVLKESFFISELLEFDFEIREVLGEEDFEDRERILREFVKFSYSLHQKGVYHLDYSPGNILITKQNGGYSFALVDLNRVKFTDFSDDLRFKSLSRFSASDADIELIAKEYARLSGICEEFAQKTLHKYHRKHQKYLQRKKLLKSFKGKR